MDDARGIGRILRFIGRGGSSKSHFPSKRCVNMWKRHARKAKRNRKRILSSSERPSISRHSSLSSTKYSFLNLFYLNSNREETGPSYVSICFFFFRRNTYVIIKYVLVLRSKDRKIVESKGQEKKRKKRDRVGWKKRVAEKEDELTPC